MAFENGVMLDLLNRVLPERQWRKEEIKQQPRLYVDDRILIPDLVLRSANYPLAIVEVKKPGQSLENALAQLQQTLDAAQVPAGIVFDGSRSVTIRRAGDILSGDEFPAPDTLWQLITPPLVPSDPRSSPSLPGYEDKLLLYQEQAVGSILDSILEGNTLSVVAIPTGLGKTVISLAVIWKMIHTHTAKSVLFLSPSKAQIDYTVEQLKGVELSFSIINNLDDSNAIIAEQLSFASHSFMGRASSKAQRGRILEKFDLIIVDAINRLDPAVFAGLENSSNRVIGFTHLAAKSPARVIFEVPLQAKFDFMMRTPPDGFTSVRLADIANISYGSVQSSSEYLLNEAERGNRKAYLLAGRHLLPDGEIGISDLYPISFERLRENEERGQANDKQVLSGDILVSSYASSDNRIKVALVKETIPPNTFFTNKIIRIRLQDELISPEDVFTFLFSSSGQQALRLVSHQERLALRDLGQIHIFLPKSPEAERRVPEVFGAAAEAYRHLKENVLPALKEVAEQSASADEPSLVPGAIADELRKIIASISSPPVIERAISDYPTPIAIAARRFKEARFNSYEQVFRLRDLFEAASFFVYHIVLADALHRLPMPQYYVDQKPARRAFDEFSMKFRLDFVEAVLSTAQEDNGASLFVPELLKTSVVTTAKSLQSEFRNVLSHTATPSLRQQENILKVFRPRVETMLRELEFLGAYRLVRVPAFYFVGDKRIARIEVYRSPAPYIHEEPLTTNIDHTHMALLDAEGALLDLHPLYQVVDVGYGILQTGQEIYDTHLGFLKYIKAGVLRGESVQGGFEIELADHAIFKSLQQRLDIKS